MSYNDEFDANCKAEYLSYREELKFILDCNIDGLVEKHDLKGEEGEDPDLNDFINNEFLAINDPVSGFSLDKKYGVDVFHDDVSYVVMERALGGPDVRYVVGSSGEAFIMYDYGSNQYVDRLGGDFDYSPLHEIANGKGSAFTDNLFEQDETEQSLRKIEELGVDSIEEWILQEADAYDTEVLSFQEFVSCLKECDFVAQDAVKLALKDGWFNVTDTDGKSFTKENFINDIESHIETLEALVEHDQFYDLDTAFGGVNENKLTNFDADDLEDELNEMFPEQKVKNTRIRKPGM
jgi:hypothetical protein